MTGPPTSTVTVAAVVLAASVEAVGVGAWASGVAVLGRASGVTSLRDFDVIRDPSSTDSPTWAPSVGSTTQPIFRALLRTERKKLSGFWRVSSYFYLRTVTPNQGDMMAKRNTRKSPKAVAPDAHEPAFDRVSNHEIAARAYEIYLARGAMSGNDLGDWLQAERELCYPNCQG